MSCLTHKSNDGRSVILRKAAGVSAPPLFPLSKTESCSGVPEAPGTERMKGTDCEVRARTGEAPLGRPHGHVPKPHGQAGSAEGIGWGRSCYPWSGVIWGDG